jgi:hypothetical protein
VKAAEDIDPWGYWGTIIVLTVSSIGCAIYTPYIYVTTRRWRNSH